MLGPQGQEVGFPCGKLGDSSLHLPSDELQTLGDGWLALPSAGGLSRAEQLLHTEQLTDQSTQMVKG